MQYAQNAERINTMYFTDDPIRDAERYMEMMDMKLESYPICAECGEHIQDEECYEIDGKLICEQCLKENYRRWTEDYIKD